MPTPGAVSDVVTVTSVGEGLRPVLDGNVSRIPAGKRGLFEGWATNQGVEADVGWRLSENWDAAAMVQRRWNGEVVYGGRVRYTW